MSEENKVRDAADAVKGIVEAVPVYQDALQPAAREIGKALGTVAKTVHIVLAPISALVWGYEQIANFVTTRVSEKLKSVPAERMKTPQPEIAGPTLEALRFTGQNETLREMYANLLATAIDVKTADKAHPAFVEIIKQLSPEEARLLKTYYSKVISRRAAIVSLRRDTNGLNSGYYLKKNISLLPLECGFNVGEDFSDSFENMQRLGLVEIDHTHTIKPPDGNDPYTELMVHPLVQLLKKNVNPEKYTVTIVKGAILPTDLGDRFHVACVAENTH